MLKLIVNADDFGLSEKTNDGIVRAYHDGILTSTSIMANGEAFEHAVSLIHSVQNLDVGVHLTLVEEKPVLSADRVPSLVNGAGKMHGHAMQFAKKYFAGKINLQEVRDELKVQIEKVLSYDVKVSHLDSHQHLHMLPKILPIVIDLANDFNIPAIRFPRDRFRFSMLLEKNSIGRSLQMLVLNFFCHLGQKLITMRTDHFTGFLFGGNLNKQNIQKVLQSLPPDGVCELMCHPGLDDHDSQYKHWGYHQEDELRALVDPEISDYLKHKGAELISYQQFARTFRDELR